MYSSSVPFICSTLATSTAISGHATRGNSAGRAGCDEKTNDGIAFECIVSRLPSLHKTIRHSKETLIFLGLNVVAYRSKTNTCGMNRLDLKDLACVLIVLMSWSITSLNFI